MNAQVEVKPDHKNIFAALAGAMSDVKRLSKDSRNVEQKYSFASVDDFLSMTGPICAVHGLIVCMDEDEVVEFERQGKYGTTFWLRIRFVVTVCHVSGECLPPSRRTVEVIRTGAQSFGSAQSYALKQFLRALLQIPTGDKEDADYAEKGEGQPTSAKAAPMVEERPARNEPTAKAVNEAMTYIEEASDLADLKARWMNLPTAVRAMKPVEATKDTRKAALEAAPPANADLSDELPY